MRTTIALGIAMLLAAACGSKKDRDGEAKAPVPAPATQAAPVDEAAVPAIPGADVADVIEAWLAAQNDGDFDAYEALYADRFYGVKRTGPRTNKYDREGWLKDRARMFRKKMAVTAEGVRVSAAPRQAIATFEQTWSSGKFRDVGQKQLVIVREGDELRIAREEMLSSTVGNAAATAAALAPEAFAFVLDEGPLYVAIRRAEDGWASGEARLVTRGSPAVAVKDASAALPAELEAWLGKPLSLFGASEDACAGRVDALEVLTGVEPHWGTVGDWEADPDIGGGLGGAGKASDERIAREVWEMGQGERWLVGRVAVRGECRAALWARVDDRNLIPRLHDVTGDPMLAPAALADAAVERLRGLEGYRLIQKHYTTDTGSSDPWDSHEGAAPRVAVFYDHKVDRRFVAVAAAAGEGCGSFYGELWALFQVVPRRGKDDELVLLTDDTDPGPLFFPEAVVDADADGDVEFVSADAVARPVGTVYRVVQRVAYPSFDCPC